MPQIGSSGRVPLDFFGSADAPFWVFPSPFPSSIGTSGTTANQVRVYQAWVPLLIRVATIHFRVQTAGAAQFAAVGVYSADGNTLLINSGAVSTAATGAKSVTLGTAVVLPPGYYNFAWTVSSATPDISAVPSPTNLHTILNAVTVRLGVAANASAAGVFPATLGAITATDINVAIMKLGS